MIRVAVAAPVCATLSHLGVCRFVLPARPLRVTGPHLRRYLRRTGRTNPVLGRVPSWYPWSQGMDEAPRCGRPPPESVLVQDLPQRKVLDAVRFGHGRVHDPSVEGVEDRKSVGEGTRVGRGGG